MNLNIDYDLLARQHGSLLRIIEEAVDAPKINRGSVQVLITKEQLDHLEGLEAFIEHTRDADYYLKRT